MRMAKWEQEWLQEMSRAHWGSAWDMKWLRRIRMCHDLQRAKKGPKIHKVISINRVSQPKMTTEQRNTYKRAAMRAAQIVCRAIKGGKLAPLRTMVCVDCECRPATAYEHRDYAKPLEVEPVCSGCNKRRGPALLTETVPTRIKKAVSA